MPWNRKDYPPNWDEIRERILIRANGCCERCNLKNHSLIDKKTRMVIDNHADWRYRELLRKDYSPDQARKKCNITKIVLTIAQLNHDKDNWEVTDDDLQALCQKCHLSLDIKHHTENRKYGRNFRKNNFKLDL